MREGDDTPDHQSAGRMQQTTHDGQRDRRAPLIVGLDVGGTKTLAVLAAADGTTLAQLRRLTGATGPKALLATVMEALAEVAWMGGVAAGDLAAVGVGVPGIVDPDAGTVRHAVNLGVGAVPLDLAKPLSDLVGGPVALANDANMAALGAAEHFDVTGDVAYLSIGTGVAAGFVLRGRIHAGDHGMAGEIGHLPVDPYGPICECGQRGCLETVASGQAIARRWPTDDGRPGDVTSLLAAAQGGDERAIAVRDEVFGHIAAALAVIAQTIDPELIVLGGGVVDAGDTLLDAVRQAIRRRAATSPLLESLRLDERVQLAPADAQLGATGAVRAARQALEGEPRSDGALAVAGCASEGTEEG